jgi:hypothetical protein
MAPRTYVDPTLPSSCARAATATEARYRIQRPVAPARAPRIIALDDGAAEVVRRTAELQWANARFYACEPGDGTVTLRGIGGRPATQVPPAGSPPHISTAQLPPERTAESPEYVQYEGRLAGTLSGNLDPPIYATDFRRGTLADELANADVVVMIATDDAGADCAYTIGKACWQRSIMTAGLVVSDDDGADRAVAALRPHARVLLPGADESDVVELLTALRA